MNDNITILTMEIQEPDQSNQFVAHVLACNQYALDAFQPKSDGFDERAQETYDFTLKELEQKDATESNPLKLFKKQLDEWYEDLYNMMADQIRDEVLNEVRVSLKDELRMELFMELKSMVASNNKQNESPVDQFKTGTIKFDTNIDFSDAHPDGIQTPMGGYESIEKFQCGGASQRRNIADSLMTNPLFSRVNKSIERSRAGEAMYTPDELVEIRKQRGMSNEDEERMRVRMDLTKFEMSDEDPTTVDKFDELFRAKYGV